MATKISNNMKRRLGALSNQAMRMIAQGQFSSALQICDQADQQCKDFPDIMSVRGLISAMKMDYVTASGWYERVCQIVPRRIDPQVNYAGCLLSLGRVEEAYEIYQRVLKIKPRLIEALNGYVETMIAIGELKMAVLTLKRMVNDHPRDASFLKKLALVCIDSGDIESALPLLEQALGMEPEDVNVLYSMGKCLMNQGDFNAARSRLHEAIAIAPDFPEALDMLIYSGGYVGREADLTAMRDLYDRANKGTEQRIFATFALGTEADKAGKYEQAFSYWSEANHQRRQLTTYSEEEQEALHKAVERAFPASRFSESPNHKGASAAAPIFIVGMPRCGSTLLEQALSRHPELHGAGEIGAMVQSVVGRKCMVRTAQLIENLTTLNDMELEGVGLEYERRTRDEYGLDGRIIDKELSNYRFVGVIAKGLPNARIIHVKRDPMASCLSIFQQHFGVSVGYSCSLEEIGRQYARYHRLMQHWHDVLPDGVMLEVNYEDIVANPETKLRSLLEHCNLEWNEDCLSGHESIGVVTSASFIQVREPIHQKSVAHWKHYTKQLAPLTQYLHIPQ